jgi:hypothetical protein
MALRCYASCRWPFKLLWVTAKQVLNLRKLALEGALPVEGSVDISRVVDTLLCRKLEQPEVAVLDGLGLPSRWPADPLGAKVSETLTVQLHGLTI